MYSVCFQVPFGFLRELDANGLTREWIRRQPSVHHTKLYSPTSHDFKGGVCPVLIVDKSPAHRIIMDYSGILAHSYPVSYKTNNPKRDINAVWMAYFHPTDASGTSCVDISGYRNSRPSITLYLGREFLPSDKIRYEFYYDIIPTLNTLLWLHAKCNTDRCSQASFVQVVVSNNFMFLCSCEGMYVNNNCLPFFICVTCESLASPCRVIPQYLMYISKEVIIKKYSQRMPAFSK
jgi:hypothetical protein